MTADAMHRLVRKQASVGTVSLIPLPSTAPRRPLLRVVPSPTSKRRPFVTGSFISITVQIKPKWCRVRMSDKKEDIRMHEVTVYGGTEDDLAFLH